MIDNIQKIFESISEATDTDHVDSLVDKKLSLLNKTELSYLLNKINSRILLESNVFIRNNYIRAIELLA